MVLLFPMKFGWYFMGLLLVTPPLLAGTDDATPEKEIPRLIGELGAEKYAAREAAQKQLLLIGDKTPDPVLNPCVQTYAATRDPEVQIRLRAILEKLVCAKQFDQAHGYLGIQIGPATVINAQQQPVNAVTVQQVMDGSPAEKAGLQAGDVILKLDDVDVATLPSAVEFTKLIQARKPGDKITLLIKRGETTSPNEVVLGEMPAEFRARLFGEDVRQEFFKNWLDERLKALTPKPKQ